MMAPRAAHLLARLPVPDWITNRDESAPRRWSPEVLLAELAVSSSSSKAELN
jgi:hypothetical protein